jgi:hypothetical protein
MKQLNIKVMEAIVKQAIEKITLNTDVITEVEVATEKHYSLNLRFKVIRDNKEYFISIKEVDVNGQVIKSHIRLDVDTNLPKKEKAPTKKELKIYELEEKLKQAKVNKISWQIFQYTHDLKKLRGY